MTRQELDGRHLESEPWQGMAEIYNDYERFTPVHIAPGNALLARLSPHPARPRPARGASVLKDKFAKIKSTYSTALQRHRRSGNPSGDPDEQIRSEEHTSELQSLIRN